MTTRTPAGEASSQTTAKDGPGAGQTAPSLPYTAELGGRVRGRWTLAFLEVRARHSGASRVPITFSARASSEGRSDSGGEAEQRGHARRVEHRRHLRVGGTALEAARGVQNSREERQVASRVQEDAGQAEDPVHRAVDVGLLLERLVPRGMRPGGGGPGPARDRLDD